MGFEMRVCPGLIGGVVVEQFAGMNDGPYLINPGQTLTLEGLRTKIARANARRLGGYVPTELKESLIHDAISGWLNRAKEYCNEISELVARIFDSDERYRLESDVRYVPKVPC